MTHWTVVFDAHKTLVSQAERAKHELVTRYGGAIYRYLLGMLRDAHAAEDLAQDFALRLVRGDFKSASPERGRFRDFLKTALRNLVMDYWRKKRPEQLPEKLVEPADTRTPDSDQVFLERWREELLEQGWNALQAEEKKTGQPFYTFLRFKADNPDLRSAQIAEQVSARLGKPMTEIAVRKTIQRARERFGELLLDEVSRSIGSTRRVDLEAELGELNLLAYCQSAVERYVQNTEESDK
jgi:RNA polymerase sigma-70 factor (ECF subfamily)